MSAPEVTRFAPSPTGPLHLGHAFSALFAAASAGPEGRFLVRIEDIDRTRCRAEHEAAHLDDLAWLGLSWERPVRRQSEHFADYEAALAALDRKGLIYPCFLTRKDLLAEAANSGRAPHGAAGPGLTGLWRLTSEAERARRMAAGEPYALRLDMAGAVRAAGRLRWRDRDRGPVTAEPDALGDVVLARKDTPASYHLAVTVDDALQGVTLVTRGLDLFESTHVHRLLQALLDLPVPEWRHHRLVTDAQGARLAKRSGAVTLAALRAAGRTAQEVRRTVAAPE